MPELLAAIEKAVSGSASTCSRSSSRTCTPARPTQPLPIAQRTHNYLGSCGIRFGPHRHAGPIGGHHDRELKVAVLGVGMMGADPRRAPVAAHSAAPGSPWSTTSRTEKADQRRRADPGCRVVADPLDAIADRDVDAVVLATPGPTHEKQLLACLEARQAGAVREAADHRRRDRRSPWSTAARSSWRRRLIQVGFMRRFDHEYAAAEGADRRRRARRAAGAALRPPQPGGAAEFFDSAMIMIRDSLVHEVDVARFLFGEEIIAVQRHARPPRIRLRPGRACPIRRSRSSRPSPASSSTSKSSSRRASPTRCAPRSSPSAAAR